MIERRISRVRRTQAGRP